MSATCLSVCLFVVCLFVCLCFSVCLCFCLSVCLSVFLSVCLFVFVNIFVSQSDSFQKFIKPQILAVFGDIALGIGLPFTDYLQVVMGVLQQASQLQVDKV